ncbi:MAG: hypothetical protein HYW26_02950 [Candidatus Aenigmarchaeota archaeon]|nr:hypothetical protein [Candidatus Aenigmarchaeota archaeon]
MARTSSVAFLIVGIIAFLGNVVFMYMLMQLGGGLNALASAEPSAVPNAGAPVEETQEFARQILAYVNIGWLWALSVLAVSLGMIYYSAQDIWVRKKK